MNSLIYFADQGFIHLRLHHMFLPQYKKESLLSKFSIVRVTFGPY